MRHTRSHTGNRRSHHALAKKDFVLDSETGQPRLKHYADPTTGTYKGKVVVSIQKKLQKNIDKISKKQSKKAESKK